MPFETYVIYLLKYGKNLCGNSEGATNTNFALNNSAVNQCPGSNNNTQLYYKPTVDEKDDVVQDGEALAPHVLAPLVGVRDLLQMLQAELHDPVRALHLIVDILPPLPDHVLQRTVLLLLLR